jgi:TolB-like protein
MSLTKSEVRAQLQRLLDSSDFTATPQRREFLSYIVEEFLAGRAGKIKGVSIAMSVFGRDETFDQQVDPIVRLEARRLRQDIDGYYAGAGREDPIRLSIPKGGYAPRFETQALSSETPLTSADPHPAPEGSPPRFPRIGLFVASAAFCCTLVWGGLSVWGAKTTPTSIQALPHGPVIAVLPFSTLGEKPEYLADGITHQLINEFVRFRDIWVLPLGSVQRSFQGETDPQTLRRNFNADFALEGSVMDTGDTLKLSARLIDLQSQRYAWVQNYTVGNAPSEIYELQDQVIRDVIGKLAGNYGVLKQAAMKTASRTPPSSRDAYDCVLSYFSYQITINLNQHEEIKTCILSAVEQNPDYAEAWAVLSNLYLQQVRFGLGGNRKEVIAAATQAARRAVDSDPNLAAGHLMLANTRFVLGDMQGFRRAGQIAMELNPNDSDILAHFGMRLAFSEDWDEGLAIVNKAIALNPVHPHWYHFPQVFYQFDQGNYQQALAVLDQIDMPDFFWTHLWGAALNEELGNEQAAEASLQKLLSQSPNFESEAAGVLSIWQLNEPFQRKLMESLRKVGLNGDA